jgi:hypothetical protein
MRRRKLVLFVSALLVISTVVSFAQTKKLTRIGVNTFAQIKGNIPTAQVMKTIAEKYADDIKYGFDQVGMSHVYLAFLDQLNAGAFTEKTIPVGDKFYWMLFRVQGKVKIWQDVEWAGKQPLPVFSLTARKDNKDYEFIIPKPCGNIALYRVTEVRIQPPALPPLCNLLVTPAKANVNDLITVDMSGTENATSMDVEVFTAQGTRVATHAFTPVSPRWQTKFDKPGEYVFRAKAVNAEGKVSENPCQARTSINFPPICKLWTSCLPCQDYVGKPIVFDANGSTDADGQIVKASFEVTDETGKVIDSFMDTEKPFTWEKVFTKAGTYAINVVVFDDMGAPSASADPCRVTFEVTQKRFFFLAEVGGLLARGTYSGFIFGRLGMMWSLSPDVLDLILRFGGALPTQGDPWKAFFMGDFLMNLHLGPAVYLDAGFGSTGREQNVRKSGVDLIGAFGVNIFNNYTNTGSIFAEVRLPVITKDRDSSNHHKLLLGFRYIF